MNPRLLRKMRREWDQRALENALHFVATGKKDWSLDEFIESGRATVENEILTDMENICQGRDPRRMRVLEIGCGAGRILRALAHVFGEVHGVDISGEMLKVARDLLAGCPNAFVHQNNGMDLSVLGNLPFDFAFSFIVFQHIPSKAVIENYVREVNRLLRPGALFKFQVEGVPGKAPRNDTWFGAPFSERDALEMAERSNFEARYHTGAGTQYFWLWFFRKC